MSMDDKMKISILIGILILVVVLISGCSSNAATGVALSDGHENTKEHLAEHELAEEILTKTSIEPIPDNARMLTLKLDGMSCPSCALGQGAAYEELDGVIETKILYKEGIGKIIYDPDKVDPNDIVELSTYTATILKDEELKE